MVMMIAIIAMITMRTLLALAVTQHADDAGAANPFEDFVTEFLEFRRRERGCLGFLKTQLGMRVELLVNTFLPT